MYVIHTHIYAHCPLSAAQESTPCCGIAAFVTSGNFTQAQGKFVNLLKFAKNMAPQSMPVRLSLDPMRYHAGKGT